MIDDRLAQLPAQRPCHAQHAGGRALHRLAATAPARRRRQRAQQLLQRLPHHIALAHDAVASRRARRLRVGHQGHGADDVLELRLQLEARARLIEVGGWVSASETKTQLPNTLTIILNCAIGIIN